MTWAILVGVWLVTLVGVVVACDAITRRERHRLKLAAIREIGSTYGPDAAMQIGDALGWVDVEVKETSTRIRIK